MRLLSLSLKGLPEKDAAIWIDMVSHAWRIHPRALPMQIVGLLMIAVLIGQSSLPMRMWLPPWACMLTIWLAVIPLAWRFRRVQLNAHNYVRWRAMLLGWRGLHGLSGGILCGLLYGGLTTEWRVPLLIIVVVFTYGLTFFAIEDLGLAMVGSAPVVLSLLTALLLHGHPADRLLAVLLVAASINGWLAGRAISRRLFEAARLRQHHSELSDKLAQEVSEVTLAKAHVEQANREKSEFFAVASHDLRQPLYSLQLLVDLLRRQLERPQHLELAGKVDVALRSLRDVFERMFDVARIEAQKIANEPRPVAIHALFQTLDHEFACVCMDKGLAWRVMATNDWIQVDPVLAQRMLRNLLENAVRYTPAGRLCLRARRRAGLVYCQVWDSGLGIARPDRDRVFQDYVQVRNAARRAQDGLGLGLGVVRRLAALTGTRLGLRSRPGRGSCFSLGFPLADQAQAPDPSEPTGAPMNGTVIHRRLERSEQGPVVFLIDDQPAVLEAVSAVLIDAGYIAIAGTCMDEVLRHAGSRELWPSLILCDYRLAEQGDGFHVIHSLRYEFGDELPAIMVTGDMSPALCQRALAEKVDLLHKPIDSFRLLQTLELALQNQ